MISKLPEELWLEIYEFAVYLWNRILYYIYKWKLPYEMFFNNKLILNHLKVYSCKAFAFIADTLGRRNRFSRLLLRAWIRYMVGYVLTN